MQKCAKEHERKTAKNIVCFENAVHQYNGRRSFLSGHGLGSKLDPTGTISVECVTLDKALANFKPSFISMDIEGSEVAALNGAKLTIQKHRPDLGICVYHYPEQIADVITKVNELDRDYKFFVRNYTGFLTETVVYACHTQK